MQFFNRRKSDDEPEAEPQTPVQTPTPAPQPAPISRNSIGFETVLGAGCIIEGKLKSEGNIRLDGVFTGTLDITGNVLVGENARITADIDAHNISIAGNVRGNVTGAKVQILASGRVWGDISATTLTTQEGAFIEGKVSMHGESTLMSSEADSHAATDAEANAPDEDTETDDEKEE